MAEETELQILLRGMRPRLSETEYAFATIADAFDLPPDLKPLGTFREEEGLTIIAAAADLAKTGLRRSAGWARISLEIHSSLSAVGLTATIASALADEGISANVVAGFFHDHFFVQWPRRHDAMNILARLAGGS